MSLTQFPPRVLFLCTRYGGRSTLAAYLCNKQSPWGKISVAARFEEERLPEGFFRLLKSFGIELEGDQPPSLFERFSAGETFDYVVLICSEESGELCAIQHLSARELYTRSVVMNWSIPDFSLIKGTPEQVQAEFGKRVAELQYQVDEFIRQLKQCSSRGKLPSRTALP